MKNKLSSPAEDRKAMRREGDPGLSFGKRLRVRAAVLFGLIAVTGGTYANGFEKPCSLTLGYSEFEAKGGRLVIVTPPDLTGFPQGFECGKKDCSGGAGFHLTAQQDGTVFVWGADHVWIGDSKGTFWREHIVDKRLQAMRVVPPQLDGKPVCVIFDVEWHWATPDKWELRPGPTLVKHAD